MEAKAIAISGLGNTQKSSLINGSDLGGEGLRGKLEGMGLRVKVYEETARQCYHLLDGKPDSVYNFQKTIHELENERIIQALEDKKSGLYDVLLIDRTWLDNIMYATQNALHGKIEALDFLKNPVDSKELYDSVILLTEPTKDSSKDEFDIYADEDFKQRFRYNIGKHYSEVVTYFRNGKEDWDAIIDFVVKKII